MAARINELQRQIAEPMVEIDWEMWEDRFESIGCAADLLSVGCPLGRGEQRDPRGVAPPALPVSALAAVRRIDRTGVASASAGRARSWSR